VAVGYLPAEFLNGFGFKLDAMTIFVAIGSKPMIGARLLEKADPMRAK
jgi:hypothetical protein